jgi:hypothetical protein
MRMPSCKAFSARLESIFVYQKKWQRGLEINLALPREINAAFDRLYTGPIVAILSDDCFWNVRATDRQRFDSGRYL